VIGRGLRRALVGLSWTLEAAGRAVRYVDIGTRPLSAMREATCEVWSDFNADEPSVDAGWMPWERLLVARFVAADDRVLLIGSGTGRDLIPFVEMGCRVTGIEPSGPAVAVARRALERRHLAATIIEGFVEEVPLEGAFDVILFSFFCYSYVFDSERRVGLLKKLGPHLADGGRILLTCHGVPSAELQPRSRVLSMARVANRWRQPGWRLERGDCFERSSQSASAFQFVHVFTKDEICDEARRGGFSPEPTDVLDAYVLRKS
jgi:SAM-dependent methyltransferase